MKINTQIATRSYYIKENFSVSLIYNIQHKIYYLLKGISSNLWDLIVKYQDFDKVYFFAQKNNLEKELNSILYELKENEIITTNKNFENSNYNFLANAISFDSTNYNYFFQKWLQFIYSHNYINTLYLELTYNCNLKCKHCFNHKNMNEYSISFEQAKKAIDEGYNLGITSVKLTGGECTLNKDFLKICEYIRSKKLELCINTNGQLLYDNEELFNKFINLYPSFVQISLYSMDENVHDSITGIKGSWHKSVNVIKKLKNAGIYTQIATIVLSYNKECYKEVNEWAESIGVKAGSNCIFINNPENNNICSKMNYNEIKNFYINKFKNNINEIENKNNFQKDNTLICEAGSERINITPKLDVTPCVAVDYILGNLNTTTLKDIKETTLKDFQKKFIRKNLTECFNEEYCGYCLYCPDTSLYNNTFMKKQPILCENAKAAFDAVQYLKNNEDNKNEFSQI